MKQLFTFLVATLFFNSYPYAQDSPSSQTAQDKSVPDKLLSGDEEAKGLTYLDFVGSGDIQQSISSGAKLNANTGIGIVFERFSDTTMVTRWKEKTVWKNKKRTKEIYSIQVPKGMERFIQSFDLESTINIASTADTLRSNIQNFNFTNKRDFGTYVLNPISARQSLYLNGNVYFGYPIDTATGKETCIGKITHYISGLNFRVIASNNVWHYDSNSVNLGVIAARMGIFYEFVPDDYRLTEKFKSRYSIFFGINYCYRGIIGDINSKDKMHIKNEIIGSDRRGFHGMEFNFGFRLNNLRAEFQMPTIFKGKENVSIEGLTNTQFMFSIKFIGGFSLKLKES